MGVVYQLVNGQEPGVSPPGLASFAVHKTIGIPNTALVAAGAVLLVAVLLKTTTVGRHFIAVGASPPAARAAGIPVTAYVVATYVLASLTYGAAGLLITGYTQAPGISAGSTYLLPTIAAVVLGGTSLAGGTGSVVATAIGALFLTQLNQVVSANGAPLSVEFVIEGGIIAVGMVIRTLPQTGLGTIVRRWGRAGTGGPRPATGGNAPTIENLLAAEDLAATKNQPQRGGDR
jgi:ribose transport system permease protein